MKTTWSTDAVMTELERRNPVDVAALIGSASTPRSRRLLRELTATVPAQLPIRVTSRRRRPLVIVAAGVGVAAAIIALTMFDGSPVPGLHRQLPSAAAAVLHRAAQAELRSTGATLGPGQFFFSQTVSTASDLDGTHPGRPMGVIYPTVTFQEWTSAAGSRRIVATYSDKPAHFSSPTSEKNWVALGSPATELATPPNYVTTQPLAEQLLNVATLPTTPSALLKAIESGKTEAADRKTEGVGTSGTSTKTFINCVALLTQPVVGSTPAFRAEVYDALAQIPGVSLLGKGADRLGRSGDVIAAPFTTPRTAARWEVIIDPASGMVLATEQVAIGPSTAATGATRATGQVISSIEYVTTGIVTSTTALPPSDRSSTSGAPS
jgi:hypothetical protein